MVINLLLDLLFIPEDGGEMFFRNVGSLSTYYKALYPRRHLLDLVEGPISDPFKYNKTVGLLYVCVCVWRVTGPISTWLILLESVNTIQGSADELQKA